MSQLDDLLAKYPGISVTKRTSIIDEENWQKQSSKQLARSSSAGAVAVVWENDGKIVLTKRTNLHAGWALPGGTVEQGESFETALIREVREETSLRVEVKRLILLEEATFIAEHTNRKILFYLALFEATPISKGQKALTTDLAKHEGLEVATFSVGDLPKEMILNDRSKIELALSSTK